MNDTFIDLYRFSEQERTIFPFIGRYINELDSWLSEQQFDDAQLDRFCLVGVYLEYLATNHQGEDFNTVEDRWYNLEVRPLTRQKLKVLNERLGRPISSTEQYLDLLGVGRIGSSGMLQSHLFDFVVNGTY
jgi:hypothetical protein